jgi:hypothetical protein
MQATILTRSGYGASFNEILLHENEIEKRPLNTYGLQKLEVEKNVYRVFQKDVPEFPLAKGFRSTETSLFIHYYKGYLPAWKVYIELNNDERKQFLTMIVSSLEILHRKKVKEVSYQEYNNLMQLEMIDKVLQRHAEIKETLEKTSFLSVNGYPCLSFEDCMKRVEIHLNQFLQRKKEYRLCYIHGDPQFNNVLTNNKATEIVFIDPRGYFGTERVYGVAEYDFAKILFALSGYDVFDETNDFEVNIVDGNLVVPNFVLDSTYVFLYPEIHFILCSIWLANAHCFKGNPSKLLISHAYARYVTTRLLGLNLESEVAKDFN